MVMHIMSSLRAELSAWDRSEGGQACFSALAVLLLVMLSTSIALTGPGGPLVGGGEAVGTLSEVEGGLRGMLREALDEALGTALEVAVACDGLDLATALDATLVALLRPTFPLEVGGWMVELLDASVALLATSSPGTMGSTAVDAGALVGHVQGRWYPEATIRVSLDSPVLERTGAVQMVVRERGPPASPNVLSSRGDALLDALSDDAGPVAYAVRTQLWEVAQGRALSGLRDTGYLLTHERTEAALVASIRAVATGAPIPVPGAPLLDLSALVTQSVEGILQVDLGWVDEYLCLGNGVAGLLSVDGRLSHFSGVLEALDGLREAREGLWDLASSVAESVALGALEAACGPLPTNLTGESLTELISHGLEIVETMSRDLEVMLAREVLRQGAGLSIARGALEGLLDALGAGDNAGAIAGGLLDIIEAMARDDGALAGLASHCARVVEAVSGTVARLALASAGDALRALKASGTEVAKASFSVTAGVADGDGPQGTLGVEVLDVTVRTCWSGEVSCEPAPLVRRLAGSLLGRGEAEGPNFGSLPYMAVCEVSVEGRARVTASTPGVSVGTVKAFWEVPITLCVPVVIATGWPLEGVEYAPSTTLLDDIVDLARVLYEAATGAVGWLVHRLRDAQEWVATQVRGIAEDLVENVLADSAYTLSRTLWSIGESLARRMLGKAMNGTWDLLVELMADDLKDRCTWSFDLFGSHIELALDTMRQRFDLRLSRGRVTANLTLARLSDPHPPFEAKPVDGYYWGVFGEARLDLGSRGSTIYFDPLTLEHPSVLTLVARWGSGDDGEPTGELKIDALEAKKIGKRTEVRLSKLAKGPLLLSLGGMMAGSGLDAGLVLHGKVVDGAELGNITLKALKDGWLSSVKGYKVGELLEATGAAPDAGLFLERVLRELYFALVHRYGKLVSELEVFVELDPPSPSTPLLRVSLVLDRPLELLLPLGAWLARALGTLVGAASTGSPVGSGTGLSASLAEHLIVRTEVVWGVDMPTWALPDGWGDEAPPEVGLKLRGQANLAALAAVAGWDAGAWEASLEVMLEGVPGAMLALVPGMGSKDWKWARITLARITLRDVSIPEVLLSQVLYDCVGRDLDLEFVELVNTGRRALDLKGAAVEDDRGRFVLGGRTPLLPGEHLLVVRNATAAREAWGVAPDVCGMRLRLSNDGDVVRLVSADGRRLDEVAWEGHIPGWEGLNATEGQALVRREDDRRANEPAAWYVSLPSPRGNAW